MVRWNVCFIFVFSLISNSYAADDHALNTSIRATQNEANWERWERLRERYSKTKLSERSWFLRSNFGMEVSELPLVHSTDEAPNWKSAQGELTAAQRARANLRLNIHSLKIDIVKKVMEMFRLHPPREIVTSPQELLEAANGVADVYLRAVDRFLESHPGARPKLGHRNLVANLVGLQNEKNAPWCADWAKEMVLAFANLPYFHPTSRLLRSNWAQSHSSILGYPIEHNYLAIYPHGNPPELPARKWESSILLLDPWRDLLPRVYFPGGEEWYGHTTNLGAQ